MPTFDVEVYSPRWGHNDTYSFSFEKDALTVSFAPRKAVCVWRENQDPLWSGESIKDMLINDQICPPDDFSGLVEYLWSSWRRGDINDSEAQVELQALVTWLNAITAAKPQTAFWSKYF